MSLNSWLCKTFDKDLKGYVEILDILKYYSCKIFTTDNYISFLLYGFLPVIIGFIYYLFQIPYGSTTVTFGSLLGTTNVGIIFFKFWLVGISLYIIFYILYKLTRIRVAKCPLNKN